MDRSGNLCALVLLGWPCPASGSCLAPGTSGPPQQAVGAAVHDAVTVLKCVSMACGSHLHSCSPAAGVACRRRRPVAPDAAWSLVLGDAHVLAFATRCGCSTVPVWPGHFCSAAMQAGCCKCRALVGLTTTTTWCQHAAAQRQGCVVCVRCLWLPAVGPSRHKLSLASLTR